MDNKQDLPDWSQFATQQDVAGPRQQMSALRHDLKLLIRENYNSLIRWMIGMYFGTMLLAGALIALVLTGMYYLHGRLG